MKSFSSDDTRVEHGSLVICSVCLGLRGRVPLREDRVEQLCSCTPVEVRRAQPRWERDDSSRWGFDYNTYAELCRCCGLVLLPSGTKWSVWFCSTCKKQITALNRASGEYLVPIGRHSLMGGVGARGADLASPEVIERLVEQTRSLFARFDGVEGYASAAVRRNLLALGFELDHDIYLGKYLWQVRRSTLTPQDGFAHLVIQAFTPAAAA